MTGAERQVGSAMGAGARTPAGALIASLRELLAARPAPVVIGIDGRSGTGKSTLAARVSKELAEAPGRAERVTVIEGDTFYAGGSAEEWDRRDPAEKAERVMDWHRQREVLADLRRNGVARWRSFDWEADDWDSDLVPFEPTPRVAHAAPVIILEGVYSCRPELHDLLDLRVLLETPHDLRRQRLLDREGDDHQADWDTRWSTAEDFYFEAVMPPERFALVLAVR